MQVVYVDLLLLTNLIVDGLLLNLTALFRHIPLRPWRMLLAAVFGAVLSLSVFLPIHHTLLQILFSFIGAIGMVFLAFSPKTFQEYGRTLGTLYLMLMTYCGVLYAIGIWLTPPGVVYLNGSYIIALNPLQLIVFAGMSYIILRIAKRFLVSTGRVGTFYTVRIEWQGQQVCIRALQDTGHTLTEPISGKPVIVVEMEAVKKLFSEEILAALKNPWSIPNSLEIELQKIGFRAIPYQSVEKGGLLPAIRVDHIWIGSGKNVSERDAYIALSPESLSGGYYQALLPIGLDGERTESAKGWKKQKKDGRKNFYSKTEE